MFNNYAVAKRALNIMYRALATVQKNAPDIEMRQFSSVRDAIKHHAVSPEFQAEMERIATDLNSAMLTDFDGRELTCGELWDRLAELEGLRDMIAFLASCAYVEHCRRHHIEDGEPDPEGWKRG